MRFKPAAVATALLGMFPGLALALALGDIELNSALNEPLDAEIEILSATAEELQDLTARVAPLETFERYGLDRPDFLSGLVFAVDRVAGRDVLKVRSRQPIAEPFVTFLVEAQWRRGRLLREYTVLLDPPVFMPQPQAAREATPAAPPPVVVPRSAASQPAPRAGVVERARQRPVSPGSWRSVPSTPAGYDTEYGPIQRGETLWGIAQRLRGDTGLTMNQIMVAIYRANQSEFLGNMNLMKEGSVLRIPDRATVASLAQQQAFDTAVAHNQAWRAGTPAQVARVAAAPATSSAATSSSDTSRLRLVEPELDATAGSAVAGGGTTDGLTREALARNEAELSRLAGENDQLRADLEEIRRLINLKDSQLADLQRQLAGQADAPAVAVTPSEVSTADIEALAGDSESPVESPAAAATDSGDVAAPIDDVADSATAPAADAVTAAPTVVDAQPQPAAEPEPEVQAPRPSTPVVTTALPEEPSFFETVLGVARGVLSSLWLWIVLGVLALAGFAAVFMRNRGTSEVDELDALVAEPPADETAIVRRPVITEASPDDVEFTEDSGTFKSMDFTQGEATTGAETAEYPFEDTVGAGTEIRLDQSDPLAEADFHLAYGLYDQAADLVRKAVEREPERIDLRMKLLEIFFVWGNQDEFRATAANLRETMPQQIAGEWDKIVIMGKQICPDDDLFAGDAGIASSADIDLEFDSSPSTSLDFDTSETPAIDSGRAHDGTSLDMDFSDDDGEVDDLLGGEDDDGLDFDLGLDMATPDEEEPTRPEPVDEIKDQIKARLSNTDTDETAEMDLSDLGVDLDLGDGQTEAADSAGGFDDVFSGADSEPTSELPAPTAELTAGAEGLDLDIGLFGSLDSEDEEETARDLAALEESMEQTSPPGGVDSDGTGHFSAEIETLHGEALDVDISDLGDDNDATRLISGDEPTGSHNEDAFSASVFGSIEDDSARTDGALDDEFSASVFGSAAGDNSETRLIGPNDVPADFSDVFGEDGSDDETVLAEAPARSDHDGMETDIFGLDTTKQSLVDLDLGEPMDDDGGDKTTVKVATAELALPDSDEDVGEVSTKLDLARAYMDMGDPDGARGILEEVLAEGDEAQQADARELLAGLS